MSFGTKKLLLNISDIERETVEFLGNFLLQECWNWIVFVRENQFIEAYYCKLRFSLNSKKNLKRIPDALQMFFRQFAEKYDLRAQRNILRKNRILKKNSKQFLKLSCQTESFHGNLFGKLLKLHSTCSEKHFEAMSVFEERSLFHFFRTMTENVRTSCWTSSNNVDKTIHYETRKTSWTNFPL